jgi:predicted O-linked N-acetylglucosamine transferase (SPINDLY family)
MTSSSGVLRLLVVLVLMMSTTGKRFHSNSFISEESGLSYLYQSLSVMMEDPMRALHLSQKAYQFKPTNHLLEVALHIHDLLGNAKVGISWAIEESSRNAQYLLYKDFLATTVALYQAEKNNEAMSLLNPWVAKSPCAIEALYHLALIHQRRGHTDGARLLYEQVLRCNPLHTSSMVNVASLYQLSGSQVDRQKAITIYETGISAILAYKKVLPGFLFLSDNELRMRANLALAYYQQLSFQKALEASQDMINLLHNSIDTINAVQSHMDVSTYVALLDGAYGNQLIISRAVVNWKGAEERLHRLLTSTLDKYSSLNSSSKMIKQTGSMVVGPYLPFDSLLDDVTLADRLSIATYTSLMFLKIQSTTTERMDTALQFQAPSKSLHIALYSTDFCDHPTTHLMLGLYLYLRRQKQRQPSTWYHKIQLIVYDYGDRDDQSDYRKRVQEFADRYVSVRDVDHDAFLDIVRHDAIDVFLEMQVHTLQTRLHVTALVADAVPSVSSFVNYLVYPGTSGSSALDHIVGDPVVLPPEHAAWYSEKFCLLPPTYQMSSYDALGLVEVDDTKERFESSAENAHAAYERWLADEIAGMPFFPRTIEDIHQLQTLYRRYGVVSAFVFYALCDIIAIAKSINMFSGNMGYHWIPRPSSSRISTKSTNWTLSRWLLGHRYCIYCPIAIYGFFFHTKQMNRTITNWYWLICKRHARTGVLLGHNGSLWQNEHPNDYILSGILPQICSWTRLFTVRILLPLIHCAG